MSTLRLSLDELFPERAELADGGNRPPRRLWRRGGDPAERAGVRWAALVWLLVFAALLAEHPERMTFDTKLGVNIDPVGFYERLWHLWNPLEYLGSLQDQYVGYAFPMGFYYLIAHVLHVPVWVAERLWMSLLIAVAFWGLVRLAEALRIGSRPTRLLAGAVFALWPTFTILVGSSSGGVLPGVLAPWAVLPLVRSASARAAAARSGVAVVCMGGINAVSTLAALVLPAVYIVTRRGRRRWALAAWWVPAMVLATAWWAGPLLYQGRYGFNFLPYIEQAGTTTQTMSAAAVLRGSGNWVAYLNFGQPWLTAGSVMTGAAWAVAAGSVAAAAGLAGLARRDLPEGLWLRCTAGVAAVCALAGYGGPLGGPLHSQVQELLDGTLSALRNVYKVEPVLAAVLALGIAHVLARVRWPHQATVAAANGAAVVVAAAVVAGLGLPYLNGQAMQPGSFGQVPGYWQQAASWLASHNGTETTLVVPADSHGIYDWGQPIDEPLEPLAQSPWVQRNLVPFSGGGVSDLLNGAEQAIESGTASPGLAGYLDRAGIRYVLVRNDLDPAQLGYTPPVVVHAALQASGFSRVASFGQPTPSGPAGQGTPLQAEAIEPEYPPVEIFQASDPADRPTGPAAVLPASATTLVDGGPASLLQLQAQGLLGTGQPTVIAGQDTSDALPVSGQDVTDGLRRADTLFGLPNNNTSYTYTATGTIPPDDPQGAGGEPPRQLLPAGTAGHQTVAVLTGAASVTASSAGSWLWEVPQGDPVNAFDADPSTAWTEASPSSPVGQWIQLNFLAPRSLSGPVTIRLLDDIPRPVPTHLIVTTAAGRAVTETRVTAAPQPLSIPSGATSWLRITIAAVSGGTAGGLGAGISEVTIPGVHVTSYLQPSQDQAGPAPSFSFQRQTATTLGLPGEPPEADLNRTFSTPLAARFQVAATVTAVPGVALNALLDRLGSGTPAQLRISATSTFGSLPALRPQNLLGGGSFTGWIADSPTATLHLQWTGRRSIDQIQLTAAPVGIAAQPTRVLITSPDGTRDVTVPQDGILNFPALVTDQMDISFPGVMPVTATNPLVGRAEQLPVGLGALTIPALAGLTTGIPAGSTPFTLSCGQGPQVTVDGRTYPTTVSGTVEDLIDLSPLPLHLCTSGSGLALPAGRHSLSTPGTAQPLAITGLSLVNASARSGTASRGVGAAGSGTLARSLRTGFWGTEYRTVTMGAGALSYLEVHQAANPGWTATLNGHSLTPVTLDGWQQAFVIPAGAGGTVVMRFTPVTGYHWLLAGSALAVLVLVAVAAWPSRRRRRRRRPGGPGETSPAAGGGYSGRRAGRAGYWLAVAGSAAVLALAGGPLAAAVPVVVLLGWWRPRWVPWLAFAAMCVAGVLVTSGLGHGAQPGFGPFGWPAQAAALIALAAALTPPGPWARRPPAALAQGAHPDGGQEDGT